MAQSGTNNVNQNNAIQRPLFAPAHPGQAGQDVDLGDVFVDYFIHEFEDPTKSSAYVQTQAVSSAPPVAGGAVAGGAVVAGAPVASAGTVAVAANAPVAGNGQFVLPTGRGIKTAWHVGAMPSMSAATAHQIRVSQVQSTESATHQYSSQSQGNDEHVAKKQKAGEVTGSGIKHQVVVASEQQQTIATVQQQPVVASGQVAGLPQGAGGGGSAISARLGISLVGGQLSVPQRGDQNAQDAQVAQVAQTAPQVVPAATQPAVGPNQQTAAATGITLPVGVGIRIGGVTDTIPASHPGMQIQNTAGIVPMFHTQWNAQTGQQMQGLVAGVKGGEVSEQVLAERRQRNREHAKRSRVRKKFLLESLQEQVRGLQKENAELRMCVQEKIPEKASEIISECCKGSPLFDDSLITTQENGDKGEVSPLEKGDFTLIKSLTTSQQNFCLSDPRLPDNPIVFASEGFFELTGYTRDEVLGRNCRFLQGPGTDPRTVDMIRKAISNGTEVTTCILNYKADGTPFWNQFFVAPLRDADNCIVNYVGVQCAVEQEAGTTVLEEKVNAVLPLQNKEDAKTDDKK